MPWLILRRIWDREEIYILRTGIQGLFSRLFSGPTLLHAWNAQTSPLEKCYIDEIIMAPCPQVDNDKWKKYGCWSLRAGMDEDAVTDLPGKSLSSKVHVLSDNQVAATLLPEVPCIPAHLLRFPVSYIQMEVFCLLVYWGKYSNSLPH